MDRAVAGGADLERPGFGVPCYVAGPYDGVVREVLLAYKHGGAYGFVRPLGTRLALPLRAACAAATRGPPVVVALPSRAARERERGYRHVEELVSRALRSARLGAPRMRALRTLRGRTGQVGLDAEARERNAERIALRRAAGSLRGREVVLVDDIVTTGATVRAAVAALERGGAEVVAIAALCAAERFDARGIPEVETGG